MTGSRRNSPTAASHHPVNARKEASAAPGDADTNHTPGGSEDVLANSRSRRRSWLRVTAGPTLRLIPNATRGGGGEPSSSQATLIRPRRTRRARRSEAKVRWPLTRQIRPTGGRAPCPAAPSGSPGRRGSPSGAGTRVSWPAAGCSAGTVASPIASAALTTRCAHGARNGLRAHSGRGLTRHATTPSPARQTGWRRATGPGPPRPCSPQNSRAQACAAREPECYGARTVAQSSHARLRCIRLPRGPRPPDVLAWRYRSCPQVWM